jgi:hypothetical protein
MHFYKSQWPRRACSRIDLRRSKPNWSIWWIWISISDAIRYHALATTEFLVNVMFVFWTDIKWAIWFPHTIYYYYYLASAFAIIH